MFLSMDFSLDETSVVTRLGATAKNNYRYWRIENCTRSCYFDNQLYKMIKGKGYGHSTIRCIDCSDIAQTFSFK